MHTATHSDRQVHGFDVTDATHRDPAYRQGDMVWVGYGGEGRWLSPTEAEELAIAIFFAAAAAASRQAAAQHAAIPTQHAA